jgi:hypothetical protein
MKALMMNTSPLRYSFKKKEKPISTLMGFFGGLKKLQD